MGRGVTVVVAAGPEQCAFYNREPFCPCASLYLEPELDNNEKCCFQKSEHNVGRPQQGIHGIFGMGSSRRDRVRSVVLYHTPIRKNAVWLCAAITELLCVVLF